MPRRTTDLNKVKAAREQQAVEALATAMMAELERTGQRAIVLCAEDVSDVALWRKAARRAGRQLGYRTRTGVTSCGVVWMADDRHHSELTLPERRRLGEARMHETARRMIEQMNPGQSPPE